MKTIMVQMSDKQWTMEALHLACAMARSIGGQVVLLRLMLANNPGLLGWGLITPPTAEEYTQMGEYAAVAEDYGVECCVQSMQYVSLIDALGQAVEHVNAAVLFASIPQSRFSLFRKFRLWSLKRQLANCRLFTLDEEHPLDAGERIPVAAVWEH